MFHTAIKIGEGRYIPHGSLPINIEGFNTIRQSFAQFGLGVRTGIDLPNEQSGFKGTSTLPGHLIDLAIGQYDTYSTMQLAQYVSTIANGGSRMEPHMVKEIREPQLDNELGPIVQEIQPKGVKSFVFRRIIGSKTFNLALKKSCRNKVGQRIAFLVGSLIHLQGRLERPSHSMMDH